MFDTQALKSLMREAVREELSQQSDQQEFQGYAPVSKFIGISGISKRDLEEKVIPHPEFKDCITTLDGGGTKRYVHVKRGLEAIDKIMIRRD